MKKYLFLLLLFTSSFLSAQDESKYLAGAVPVVDGKVTFTYTFENVQMSQQQIYDTLLKTVSKQKKNKIGDEYSILIWKKDRLFVKVPNIWYLLTKHYH